MKPFSQIYFESWFLHHLFDFFSVLVTTETGLYRQCCFLFLHVFYFFDSCMASELCLYLKGSILLLRITRINCRTLKKYFDYCYWCINPCLFTNHSVISLEQQSLNLLLNSANYDSVYVKCGYDFKVRLKINETLQRDDFKMKSSYKI